jgi:hypothetical protein
MIALETIVLRAKRAGNDKYELSITDLYSRANVGECRVKTFGRYRLPKSRGLSLTSAIPEFAELVKCFIVPEWISSLNEGSINLASKSLNS